MFSFFINIKMICQTQNLVVNPGFEIEADGSVATGFRNSSGFTDVTEDVQAYWDEILGWSAPNGDCNTIGSSDCMSNQVRTGNRYGSLVYQSSNFGWKEYIVAELKSSLINGHIYYIEMYVKGKSLNIEEGKENYGIKLFNEMPEQCKRSRRLTPDKNDNAQIEIPFELLNGGSSNPDDYQKVTLYYTCDNDYTHIALGFFGKKSNSASCELDIDDIRIFDLGLDKCADGDWYFQNTDLYNHVYTANDKIVAGRDVSPEFFIGDVVVKNNNAVWFKAGNQIILEPGFSTEDGAYFETIIESGCTEFDPCAHIAPFGDVYYSCFTNPVTIGPSFVEDYVTYSWSPTTNLSDPNSPNPVFTPPTSGQGYIDYFLTLDAVCGGFLNFDDGFSPNVDDPYTVTYRVYYNANPDPNPSFTITNSNLTRCNADFSIAYNAQTEFVYVDVIDPSNGNTIFSQTYTMNPNICCNFSWNTDNLSQTFWDIFNSCKNYTIRIRTTNFCYPNTFATQEIQWNNNVPYQLNLPLGNFISPNGDGVNDWFKFDANGVQSYSLYIYNRWGNLVFRDEDVNYCSNSQSGKLWSGQCNTAICSKPCVVNGQYIYILEYTKCQGGGGSYNGWITNFAGNPNVYCVGLDQKNLEFDEDYSDELPLDEDLFLSESNFLLYPNPTTNSSTLRYAVEEESTIVVSIYDINGALLNATPQNIISGVGEIELEVSNYASGMYFVVVEMNGELSQRLKLVVNK